MQHRVRTRASGEISLLAILSFLSANRTLITLVMGTIVFIGGLYALMAPAVYKSSALIRVSNTEDAQRPSAPNLAAFLDARSAPSAELEMVRTRSVVAKAVEVARLDIVAEPKRFPLIGAWFARRNKGLSQPGIMGWGGYAWGQESLTVGFFEVPKRLERKPFSLKVIDKERYSLRYGEVDAVELEGRVGETLQQATDEEPFRLRIDTLNALPGTEFVLARSSKEDAAESLLQALSVTERGKQSSLIAISLEGADPALTASVVNEIARQYIQRNIDLKTDEAERSLGFLEAQLPALRTSLEAAEARYSAFRGSRGTADVSEEVKAVLQQSVQAQIRLSELRQRRAELLTRFQNDNPIVDAVNQQIKTLSAELSGANDRLRTVPATEQELARLTRDVKVNGELYASLLNTAQQLRLTRASRLGSAKLIDEAVPSSKPVAPKRGLLLSGFVVLGAVLAILAALLRNALKSGISNQQELANAVPVPLVAVVPHSTWQAKLRRRAEGRHQQPRLLAEVSTEEGAVESLRTFRAMLEHASRQARNNIVMFTGPTAGVGKSFIAVNFSALLARSGKRVLLVDGDLRGGRLHHQFGLRRAVGLGEYILNRANAADIVTSNVLPNLSFMSTGALRLRAGDALASSVIGPMLTNLARDYDHVVIDTPPVLPVADALTLAGHVGLIYCVARQDTTSINQVAEVCARFDQGGSPVDGIIFNDATPSDLTYGYGIAYSTVLSGSNHAPHDVSSRI